VGERDLESGGSGDVLVAAEEVSGIVTEPVSGARAIRRALAAKLARIDGLAGLLRADRFLAVLSARARGFHIEVLFEPDGA
jgi:hypothetical protein